MKDILVLANGKRKLWPVSWVDILSSSFTAWFMARVFTFSTEYKKPFTRKLTVPQTYIRTSSSMRTKCIGEKNKQRHFKVRFLIQTFEDMACTKVPPKVSHTPYISFYNYKQLTGNRSIRVAQFQPSSGPTCPLRCDLEVISLDDCAQQNSGRDPKEPKIQYTAISYAWDSQRPSQPIICNGKVLLVTKNCAAALRRLRNDTETRNFWVDSICINQDEDAVEERNQQVALMGEIYSRATDVAVWIGEADYESAVAIIAIPMIYESIPLDPIAPLDTDKPMTESTTAFKKSLKQHMNKMIFGRILPCLLMK